MTKPELLLVSPLSGALMTLLAQDYLPRPAHDPALMARQMARGTDRVQALVGHHRIDEALMRACPAARLICTFAAGYENVDLQAARALGRIVCNTPGASAEEVADSAALLVLAGMKRLRDLDALVREGRWPSLGAPPPRRGLRGAAVGVAGAGDVGQAILRRMAAFGADLHYHARRPRDLPARYHPTLDGLARTCEVLILALPGGLATRQAVDAPVMRALGPDGLLVNLARGSVVDEEALIACLSDGSLGFAALDVFATEPDVPQALRALPNTLFMPHYAGASLQARAAKGQLLRRVLALHFAGQPVPWRVP